MACDTLKDNSKMACFTWHVPSLVSLLHTVEMLLVCSPPSLLSCENATRGLLRTPATSRVLPVPLWHVPPHTPSADHQGQEGLSIGGAGREPAAHERRDRSGRQGGSSPSSASAPVGRRLSSSRRVSPRR